ncbi:hypothetical protein GF325_12385 [Candidatus Bathyarchaeota archaeon]|nr:hypothetical protein [Candidatus Bathyarchaeota archaeon]
MMDWSSWKEPEKKHRPMVRWWWPGLDVNGEELVRELVELDASGFGGVEIQAFLIGSPSPNHELKHRFAPNPAYYDMVEIVLEKARELGMIVDLTVSSSWPPGGSWVPMDDSLRTLLMGTTMVEGPQRLDEPVPPIKLNTFYKKQNLIKKFMGGILASWVTENRDQWLASFKPLATVAVKPIKSSTKMHFLRPRAKTLDISTATDISDLVDDHGILHWDVPEGKWQIFTIYRGPSGMTPISDAKSDPRAESLVVDMFDRNKVKRFLDGHLGPAIERFKPYMGETLRAIFTDSQEIGSEWFWTGTFFKEFEDRRGYDVRKYLPVNFVPNRDNQFLHVVFQNLKPCFDFVAQDGERIRHDWEHTLSDLFAENYCGAVSRWGAPHGIKHRIQTYGFRADLLKAYGQADIPETEQLFAGGVLDFLKLAGSAGIVYQKPIVSSESLVWMQRDYMTTPLKWKVAVDRLFVSGINQVIYHGFPYAAPWKEFPGHYPWSPPDYSSNLNENNSFWKYFPLINDYVTRCQSLLQQGKIRCNIGIFYPHFNYDYKYLKDEDLGGGYLEGYDGKPPSGIIVWWMNRVKSNIDKMTLKHQQVGDKVMERGYFYAHVNEEVLLEGNVDNKQLACGDARFDAIIFPFTTRITLKLARFLDSIVERGVNVIFYGDVPDGQPGFLEHEINDEKIKHIMGKLDTKFHFLEEGDDLGLFLEEKLLIPPGIDYQRPVKRLQYICKDVGDKSVYFIRSGREEPLDLHLRFWEAGKIPFELDPWTGEARLMPVFSSAVSVPKEYVEISITSSQTRTTIPISLAPYGSKMIMFVPEESCAGTSLTHVDHASIQVTRKDTGTFQALTCKPGKYSGVFKDGRKFESTIVLEPPPVMPIHAWKLDVQHRDIDGTTEVITEILDRLKDWRDIKSLKGSCGPGTYTTKITLPDGYFDHDIHLSLDLGKVHDVAEITVNGKPFPPILVPPYKVEISGLQDDSNSFDIQVTVTGTLRNLLVGYGKRDKRWKHYKKRKRMPVGILGPATIVAKKIIKCE